MTDHRPNTVVRYNPHKRANATPRIHDKIAGQGGYGIVLFFTRLGVMITACLYDQITSSKQKTFYPSQFPIYRLSRPIRTKSTSFENPSDLPAAQK